MSKAIPKDKSEWLSIFTDWEQSGLTHKQYCDQHSINIHTFRNKKKHISNSSTSKTMTNQVVPIELPTLPSSSVIELKLPNGTEIKIPMQ